MLEEALGEGVAFAQRPEGGVQAAFLALVDGAAAQLGSGDEEFFDWAAGIGIERQVSEGIGAVGVGAGLADHVFESVGGEYDVGFEVGQVFLRPFGAMQDGGLIAE